jgi:hypothetical protein
VGKWFRADGGCAQFVKIILTYLYQKVNEYIEKLAKTWQRIRGMQQKRRLSRAKAKGAKPRETALLPF